jgi:hypothetical protein
MIVWGGYNGSNPNTGGRYNPTTDSWVATSTTNAPSGREVYDTGVWTGTQMIVWGGYNGNSLNSGGSYNPTTDSWTATTTTGAPAARNQNAAVWTGTEMIVWGIERRCYLFNTGGRYNPSANSWTSTSTSNAPTARGRHTEAWTGSQMIVWGGADSSTLFSTGGRTARLHRVSREALVTSHPQSCSNGRACDDWRFYRSRDWTKAVIIRAIGPELTQWDHRCLSNPRLELHNGTGALIASNDDWQTTILGGIITSNQVSDIQNSGHAPTAASESAIIANLQPGNYTAINGVNNTSGVALVEVYDGILARVQALVTSAPAVLFRRASMMIGGLLSRDWTKRVIIRAIGPELTQFGITDALANPRLELHTGPEH